MKQTIDKIITVASKLTIKHGQINTDLSNIIMSQLEISAVGAKLNNILSKFDANSNQNQNQNQNPGQGDDSPTLINYDHLISFYDSGQFSYKPYYGAYYLKSQTTNSKIYSRLDDQYTLEFTLPLTIKSAPILKDANGNSITYTDVSDPYVTPNVGIEDNTNNLQTLNKSITIYRNWNDDEEYGDYLYTLTLQLISSDKIFTQVGSLPSIIEISGSSNEAVNGIYIEAEYYQSQGAGQYGHYIKSDGSISISFFCDDFIEVDGEQFICATISINNKKEGYNVLYYICALENRSTDWDSGILAQYSLDQLNSLTQDEYLTGTNELKFSSVFNSK